MKFIFFTIIVFLFSGCYPFVAPIVVNVNGASNNTMTPNAINKIKEKQHIALKNATAYINTYNRYSPSNTLYYYRFGTTTPGQARKGKLFSRFGAYIPISDSDLADISMYWDIVSPDMVIHMDYKHSFNINFDVLKNSYIDSFISHIGFKYNVSAKNSRDNIYSFVDFGIQKGNFKSVAEFGMHDYKKDYEFRILSDILFNDMLKLDVEFKRSFSDLRMSITPKLTYILNYGGIVEIQSKNYINDGLNSIVTVQYASAYKQ